jgi:hypothetical protein
MQRFNLFAARDEIFSDSSLWAIAPLWLNWGVLCAFAAISVDHIHHQSLLISFSAFPPAA